MNSKTFLAALLLLLGITSAYAQSAGNFLYSNDGSFSFERANIAVNIATANNVALKAEIMMNVRPSSFTAIFSVVQSGIDVSQVDSTMSGRLEQVIYGLMQLGISEKDIHIDAVSMVPTYAQKWTEKKFGPRSTEIPVGFEMKKNIHVLFRDHAILDAIISEMAFADIYDLVKVEYNIDGIQTYYDQLRQAAIEVIRSKEATYTAMKLHLDVYSMADGYTTSYPAERYKSYTAYNSGSSYFAVTHAITMQNNYFLDGKRNTMTIDGNGSNNYIPEPYIVQSTEKNKTIYFDRVPYNQFDKVINADIEEPCIQLMYSLQSSYTMMTEEQYQKNKEQLDLQKKIQEQSLLSNIQHGQKHKGRRGRYQ